MRVRAALTSVRLSQKERAGTVDGLRGRRVFRRFCLAAPALFRWRDEEEHQEIGCCSNVGMGGLFILTSRVPPLEAEVRVEIVLPAFDPAAREIRLNCAGRVIRTQDSRHLWAAGFAVVGGFEWARRNLHGTGHPLEDYQLRDFLPVRVGTERAKL